jgi:serine/threonine protein kinase
MVGLWWPSSLAPLSGSATPRSEATTVAGTLSPARDASPGGGSGGGTRESSCGFASREPSCSSTLGATGGGGGPAQQAGERRRASRHMREVRLLDGKYVIGEELGRGSSGKVYRALNKVAGQIVAIKEIPLVGISSAAAKAVQSEVELLHRLQHPQIVRFHETIRTTEHLYVVLEYVENGSLASLLKTFGKLPEHMLVVFMRQVLVGLEWLHAQGICHRDIKGANLLTTKDGQVKLADFGVAGTLKSSHEDRQAEGRGGAGGAGQQAPVGTPYWMAPEIIEMSGFTTASDIWSLGCTVLELFTGEPPYFDLRWVNALYRIVQDTEPPIPAGMPPLLDAFLRCCFVRDPTARATAAQLGNHAWLSQDVAAGCAPAQPHVRSPDRLGRMVSHTTVDIRRPRSGSVSGSSTDPDPRNSSRTNSRSGVVMPIPQGPSAEAIGQTHGSAVSTTGPNLRGGHSAVSLASGSLPSESSPAMLARGQVIPRADSLYTIESTSPTSSCPSTFSRKESRPPALRPPSAQANPPARGAERSPVEDEPAAGAQRGRAAGVGRGDGQSSAAHDVTGCTTHAALQACELRQGDRGSCDVRLGDKGSCDLRIGDKGSLCNKSRVSEISWARLATADCSSCASSARGSAVSCHGSLAASLSRPASAAELAGMDQPPLEPIASSGSLCVIHSARHSPRQRAVNEVSVGRSPRNSVNLGGVSVAGPGGTACAHHAAGGEVLLSGCLWKRGAHWLSFSYHRRYFFLQDGVLAYLSQSGGGAAPANGARACPRDSQPSGTGGSAGAEVERRIPLSSIVNIRVTSKVKLEFELARTDRAFRMRAPSAQALALWVTTISNEWMRILQREAAIGLACQHVLTAAGSSRARSPDADSESTARIAHEPTVERQRHAGAAAATRAVKHPR